MTIELEGLMASSRLATPAGLGLVCRFSNFLVWPSRQKVCSCDADDSGGLGVGGGLTGWSDSSVVVKREPVSANSTEGPSMTTTKKLLAVVATFFGALGLWAAPVAAHPQIPLVAHKSWALVYLVSNPAWNDLGMSLVPGTYRVVIGGQWWEGGHGPVIAYWLAHEGLAPQPGLSFNPCDTLAKEHRIATHSYKRHVLPATYTFTLPADLPSDKPEKGTGADYCVAWFDVSTPGATSTIRVWEQVTTYLSSPAPTPGPPRPRPVTALVWGTKGEPTNGAPIVLPPWRTIGSTPFAPVARAGFHWRFHQLGDYRLVFFDQRLEPMRVSYQFSCGGRVVDKGTYVSHADPDGDSIMAYGHKVPGGCLVTGTYSLGPQAGRRPLSNVVFQEQNFIPYDRTTKNG